MPSAKSQQSHEAVIQPVTSEIAGSSPVGSAITQTYLKTSLSHQVRVSSPLSIPFIAITRSPAAHLSERLCYLCGIEIVELSRIR